MTDDAHTSDSTDVSNDGRGARGSRVDHATRRSVIKTVGAGAVAAGFGAGAVGTGAAVSIPTPTLHTEGRWVRDPSGNDVRLRGFAPASLDFIARSWYPKSWEEILEWGTDGSRGWHPTVVRIPVTYSGVNHHGGIETFVSEYLRPAVDYLASRDVYAMIDFHLIRPYTQQATEDYNADQSEESNKVDPIDDVMRDFWTTVAPEFAEDSHVIYEMFNEPTYPNTWGSYGENVSTRRESWDLWRETAQPWLDLIQENAPERPVVIGSPDWTSETQHAPAAPFEGDNLIYAAHIYPDNGQPSEFDAEYGAPAEEVPCFLTEFGWDGSQESQGDLHHGTNEGWGQPVREWVEGYDNYHWTAWCFDDSWAPTFFESPADNPSQGAAEPWGIKPEGEFVKAWLDETKDLQNPTSTIEDSQAPPTPSNLAVERTSEISATVSWDAVTDNGEAGLSHYTVYLDGTEQQQVLAEETAATVDGLSPESSYEVGVDAVDELGNASSAATVTVETIARDENQSPYQGENVIPGKIEAEAFDQGGPGVAYHDTTDSNQAGGTDYRDTTADIGTNGSNGYNIGYINPGEWWEYTVQAEGTGTYVLFVNAANGANQSGTLRVEIDGEEVVTHDVWPTNGWGSWTEMRVGPIEIDAGEHVVRLVAESAGYNLDWIRFEGQDVSVPTDDPTDLPAVGDGSAPQDPDEDGLYEDVNGDGSTNLADAGDLFQHRNGDAVQNNVDAYDFSGNDEIDLADVVQLFQENTN